MHRWVKRIAIAGLVLVAGAGGFYGWAWWQSEAGLARPYAVADAPLRLPTDPASLEHGRHLFETRGCGDCHAGGVGALVFDAGPLIRLVAPNITPAALAARGYDTDRIAAAIRHGVRADGTPLVFMPAGDWSELSDADTAALIAYMATLPASDNDPGATEIRPLARVLHALGKFPLIPAETLDHAPRERSAPQVGENAEYGRYVAAVCTGCHGPGLHGGAPLAAGTPSVPDLTPSGLGDWSEPDFFRLMREGRRPDGRELHPIMPWPSFAKMSDTELRAIWLHLRRLPPRVAD